MFSGYEASKMCDLLMDYNDETPGYDSIIQKLLAARDFPQDYTKNDDLLMLDAINEYLKDSAVLLTPSYDSHSFSSVASSSVLADREFYQELRCRIQSHLSHLQSEA